MRNAAATQIASPYKGSGQITREQFLLHEMRTTARLINDGIDKNAVVEKSCQRIYSSIRRKSLFER